jgi:hypothetical protein
MRIDTGLPAFASQTSLLATYKRDGTVPLASQRHERQDKSGHTRILTKKVPAAHSKAHCTVQTEEKRKI